MYTNFKISKITVETCIFEGRKISPEFGEVKTPSVVIDVRVVVVTSSVVVDAVVVGKTSTISKL